MWTFETQTSDESWKVSSCTWITANDAVQGAFRWILVCAENDQFPAVRLVKTAGL